MSALTIYSDQDARIPLWHGTDCVAIQHRLEAKSVRFERWYAADLDMTTLSTPEAIIKSV